MTREEVRRKRGIIEVIRNEAQGMLERATLLEADLRKCCRHPEAAQSRTADSRPCCEDCGWEETA